MPKPFEFVVMGVPVSQQTRRRERLARWRLEVENAAKQRWDAGPPNDGAVMVIITYVFEGPSLDVDNVPKPVLDALKGLVYEDDSQVTDLLCRKRGVRADPGRKERAPAGMAAALARRVGFVHVLVTDAPSLEATSW